MTHGVRGTYTCYPRKCAEALPGTRNTASGWRRPLQLQRRRSQQRQQEQLPQEPPLMQHMLQRVVTAVRMKHSVTMMYQWGRVVKVTVCRAARRMMQVADR